ncbi:MAG: M48 family metallopeptidase [Clostridia bacterium]|nr:M48 family metallopeptidase [Clostridia bacterium]
MQIRDGGLLVRAPYGTPLSEIERIISGNRSWVEKQLKKAAEQRENALPPFTAEELKELSDRAAEYLPQRVRYYAPIVGVEPKKIAIRSQRTKWGSCSAKGTISFNCILMLAPPGTVDAVVVHELCHLKRMDHSPAFYAEVTRVLPDYKERDKWLKKNGSALFARMR